MAGFFKKLVDRLSGYPDDAEFDYDNEYDYEEQPAEEYDTEPGYPSFSQQERYKAPIGAEPTMQYSSVQRSAPQKVVPLKSSGEQQLVIMQPNNIQSAQRVCDHLRAGHMVICNIENVDAKIAQRVIDFISGSTYAMDGNVKPIDARAHSFVAVPRTVSLIDKELAPQQAVEYPEQYRMAR
ncbi:MAG: cell division protein SepF [Clostridiaceae bacterium]|nr:cell division protein SepF [Clostridiaceae bacterium]